ncbi:MAG: hypothetical protein JJ971_06465 [Balneolaceae bacterium]|nr:hypothetical protein [Balneolaceae bacterium]MBO6546017.1 hypothetical protein [Balneolaceae bacterium]MBO6647413.1 hypothetical protein [Balneolaceae bacterium]
MDLNLIFLINLSASLFLTGLIWTIQLVHYPAFHFVDEADFLNFHPFHNRRISFIVIPVMITELITSGFLWWNDELFSLNAIGFYLVCLIWTSTFLLSVPNHAKLAKGKDDIVITSLVNTNWVRTILWTVKAGLSVFICISI